MERAWRLLTRSNMDKLARGCDMVVPEDCDDACQSILSNLRRKRNRFLTDAEFTRLGLMLVPKVTTCPRFVRIAAPCSDGTRNAAEFLDSSICRPKDARRLSSCRNRIESNSRPRLAFLRPLGVGTN